MSNTDKNITGKLGEVSTIVTQKEASIKIFSFPCGCESIRCFQKHDCTAPWACNRCPDRTHFSHCGTHQGTPDICNASVSFC